MYPGGEGKVVKQQRGLDLRSAKHSGQDVTADPSKVLGKPISQTMYRDNDLFIYKRRQNHQHHCALNIDGYVSHVT